MSGIIDSAMDAIVSIDVTGHLILFNRSAEKMFGRESGEVFGQPLDILIPQRFRAAHGSHIRGFAASGMTTRAMGALGKIYGLRATGEEFPIEASISQVGKGETRILTVILRDVTEREKAVEALRESEERLRLALDAAAMGMFDWEIPEGRILLSPAHEALWGFAEGTSSGTYDAFLSRLHAEDLDGFHREVRRCIGERLAFEREFRVVWPDGSVHWITCRGNFHFAEDGRPLRMLGTVVEISEKKAAQAALTDAHERLQLVSRRLVDVEENSRRHLARELHDEIGQALSAVKIDLQTLQRFPEPAETQRLDSSVAIVDRALQQVRTLSLELRPPLLDDLGLTAALRWVANRTANAGPHVEFREDIGSLRFEPIVETACFRIVQESMTNIVRHAAASQVTIRLQNGGDRLHLHIHDDGRGFDVAAARHRATLGESLGMVGMEDRVALLGGEIHWHSDPVQGTFIDAWIRCSPEGDQPAERTKR
jgi:two-component system sensor histidine kinase UhpB